MTRHPFILLAFAAVMLQVMTFGACRPRPRVEVFLSTGVVASVSDHHHPHGGAVQHHDHHHHAPRAAQPSEEADRGARDESPAPTPGHVHLWDISPVATRTDRNVETAPLQPAPALGMQWLDTNGAAPGCPQQRSVAPVAGAPPGLRTTRLLI